MENGECDVIFMENAECRTIYLSIFCRTRALLLVAQRILSLTRPCSCGLSDKGGSLP